MQNKGQVEEESKKAGKNKFPKTIVDQGSGHKTHRNPPTYIGKSVDVEEAKGKVRRSSSRSWIRSIFCCLSASQKGLPRRPSNVLLENKNKPKLRRRVAPEGHNELESCSSIIERRERRSISDESGEDATNLLRNDGPRMVTRETQTEQDEHTLKNKGFGSRTRQTPNLKLDIDAVIKESDDFYRSNSSRPRENKHLYESPHPRDPIMPNSASRPRLHNNLVKQIGTGQEEGKH